MQYVFDWLLNGAINFTNGVIDVITTILPTSPFDQYITFSQNVPFLAMLNYFVPIGAFVSITIAWAQALLFFYGQAVVARWVKILKG